jgi:hypothetical protein
MTKEEYEAAVRSLGLRPSTNAPNVYIGRDGTPQNVPDPNTQTYEQRAATIKRIRFAVLGTDTL